MNKLAFIGAGSHADAVLPVVNRNEFNFVGFFDDKGDTERNGYPILGRIDEVEAFLEAGKIDWIFITIGENQKRAEIFNQLKDKYYDRFINIISNHAYILTESSIQGRGIFIGISSFLGAQAVIKDNSIINTGAIVEHHTIINKHCNICPNATINGYGEIGEGAYIGSGSITIQVVTIPKWTMIGAGATVVKSLSESGTYVGVPAKKIK